MCADYELAVQERRRTRDIQRGIRDTLQDQVDNDAGRGAQPSANVLTRLEEAESTLSEAEASLLAAEEALALCRMNLGGRPPVRDTL